MRELFIYYRTRPECAAEVAGHVRQCQGELCRLHPHLEARLLRRPETADGLLTWMETYSIDPMHGSEGVSTDLQRDIEAQATVLRPFIAGVRHLEVFLACAW